MHVSLRNNTIIAYVREGEAFGMDAYGTVYYPCCPDHVNGINYASDWNLRYSIAEKAALGIVEMVMVGQRGDDASYWNSDVDSVINGVPTRTTTATLKDIEPLKANKLVALAQHRYNVETGGMTVNGMKVATDDRSKSLINGAFNLCQAVPTTTVQWKTPEGFIPLTAAQVTAIAVAMGQFVQACFAAEAVHITTINALATAQEVLSYDITTGWPS